jgi:hypothetical protein
MTQNIAVLASLGVAILLSPEITVLGLIAASDKKIPRTCAWVFGIGSIVGLAFALAIGFGLAQAHGNPHSELPEEPSWSGFIIRSVIALGLLALGIYRIVNAILHAPVEKTPEQRERSLGHRFHVWFKEHFPRINAIFDGSRDLPPARRAGRWGFLGFACNGLHPKVFPIAIAAGHETLQIKDDDERALGILVFAAISLVPSLLPAVIETIHPGISSKLKDSFERFMKVNGRWISAAFILAVAAFVGHNAWNDMPGREKHEAPTVKAAPVSVSTTPATPAAK